SQVAQLGYDLAHLQSRHDELELDNSRLGYELARYESLDTVAKVATEKLGMTPLARYQFLQVQLPAEQNLPPVAPLRAAPESLAHRLLRVVLGTGRATAPASGEPALSGVGGGSR
ncbi:MAG: hypothetical protein IRY97_04225, partial [Thermomicrobiaceae bacterium]|nr:hypothetical protein [Thermomicrobiaceae bacterium]